MSFQAARTLSAREEGGGERMSSLAVAFLVLPKAGEGVRGGEGNTEEAVFQDLLTAINDLQLPSSNRQTASSADCLSLKMRDACLLQPL